MFLHIVEVSNLSIFVAIYFIIAFSDVDMGSKMAGGRGGVIVVVKFFIVWCLAERINTWRESYNSSLSVQDQVETDSVYKLRPNYQLSGFKGYYLLQTNSRSKHSASTSGLLSLTINSEKWFKNKYKVCNLK